MLIISLIKHIIRRLCELLGNLLKKLLNKKKVELCNYAVPNKIIGGYFWANTLMDVYPSHHFNPGLLTHIYYAFLEIKDDGAVQFQNTTDNATNIQYIKDLIQLRERNPNLKLLFSVVTKKDSFSTVTADGGKRRIFLESVVAFLATYDFNGLDLDWEFPKESDKNNFVELLKELNTGFKQKGYILTAAVRAIPIYENSGYDVPRMVQYLNIINVMTYDFYGGWSDHTGFNSPLFPSAEDSGYERKYLSVDAAINNWIQAGAPKEKICVGIPFYGRTFTLTQGEDHGVRANSMGAGKPAAVTYYQVKTRFANWERVWNDEQKAPYKFHLDQWIGYDDEESIREKVKYVLEHDLAGVFIWQLGGDDLTGEASDGAKQYLLTNIYKQIIQEQEEEEKELSEPPHIELVSDQVPEDMPEQGAKSTHSIEDVE